MIVRIWAGRVCLMPLSHRSLGHIRQILGVVNKEFRSSPAPRRSTQAALPREGQVHHRFVPLRIPEPILSKIIIQLMLLLYTPL